MVGGGRGLNYRLINGGNWICWLCIFVWEYSIKLIEEMLFELEYGRRGVGEMI